MEHQVRVCENQQTNLCQISLRPWGLKTFLVAVGPSEEPVREARRLCVIYNNSNVRIYGICFFDFTKLTLTSGHNPAAKPRNCTREALKIRFSIYSLCGQTFASKAVCETKSQTCSEMVISQAELWLLELQNTICCD